MKSISPLIATILMITITVSMSGLLYMFLTGTFNGLLSSSSSQISKQSQYISFSIVNTYCSNNKLYFIIYNNGNIPININNAIINIQEGNNYVTVNGSNIICNNGDIIIPGSNGICYINNSICYYNSNFDINPQINIIYQGVSNSKSLGTGYIVIPSPIFGYAVLIYNFQNIPTLTPFQQDIAICNGTPNVSADFAYVNDPTLFNEINLNGSNVYFFSNPYNPTGSLLYSWFEGQDNISQSNTTPPVYCDVWWVNIPNGIPANGYDAIYMEINSTSTSYYNQYFPYVGINPYWLCYTEGYSNTSQCPNYGQYDNGQNVFLYYWNFNGTSLPPGWAQSSFQTTSSSYVIVDNGVTLINGGGIYTNLSFNISNYYDFDMYVIEPVYQSIFLFLNNTNYSYGYEFGPSWGNAWSNFPWSWMVIWSPFGNSNANLQYTPPNVSEVFSAYDIPYNNENNIGEYYYYGNQLSMIRDNVTNFNTLTIWVYWGGTYYLYWFRIRYYPPNGVMPSIYLIS